MSEAVPQLGDLVEAIPPSLLFCGSGIYRFAVVVSVNPFVLVSEQGDMVWFHKKASDVRPVGRAFDATLAIAVKRYNRDLDLMASIGPKRKRVFYIDGHSTNESKLYAGDLDNMDDLIRGLGNYMRAAIATADGDFDCTISFKELTDEELEALPED